MAAPETRLETDASYGSDRDGLVWGYRFEPDEPGRPTECGDAAQALTDPAAIARGQFAWLHFSLANAASERWLRRALELPDAFYDSLSEPLGATRVERDEDRLVAVLHDVTFDFTFDPEDVSTVCLCIGPSFLVTARIRPLRSVDQLRAAVKRGERFRSSVDLLAHQLRSQADVLVQIVRQSTSRVDAIEDRLLANRASASRRELGALRRVLVRLQRLLAPEPAALFRLLSRPPAWIAGEDLHDLRAAAEEFNTAVADSAALVERVKLLQEELTALVDEQTNRTLFVLTVVTVSALPINLVAGLFGMNVGGIPLAEAANGFWTIALTLVACTALLLYWTLLRRRD
ncbi:MAG: transporter [Gemmatimonadales bacterium]|nr:transporter [Gemmatimonadales bacterium]